MCRRRRTCLASRSRGSVTRHLHNCLRSSKVEQPLGMRPVLVRFPLEAQTPRWRRGSAGQSASAWAKPNELATPSEQPNASMMFNGSMPVFQTGRVGSTPTARTRQVWPTGKASRCQCEQAGSTPATCSELVGLLGALAFELDTDAQHRRAPRSAKPQWVGPTPTRVSDRSRCGQHGVF